jgi:hypothetical protein
VVSKEYRELADECLGWAKAARTDRERHIFLGMAETWLRAAARADQREKKTGFSGKPRRLIAEAEGIVD